MPDQADEHVRCAIRDAMDRLIEGKALHSDGKLTVKSLAEEARVKRWLLTHRHTDLQDSQAVYGDSGSHFPTAVVPRTATRMVPRIDRHSGRVTQRRVRRVASRGLGWAVAL